MDPIPLLGLLTWCAALGAADLRRRRLPNLLTLPGAAVVLGYAWLDGRWAVALVGALLLAVPYLLIHLTMPSALGAGDVKLALGLGGACALA
ncbi:prepilin peptidase, partial [Nocardia sp. CC201C]